MTANVTLRRMPVNVGEIINDTIDIEGLLKGTEVATGTPLIVQLNGVGTLTIVNKAVNTAEQIVDGRTVAIGEGIDYTISGFVSGLYKVKITFSTNASVPATRVGEAQYEVCG